MKRLSNRFVLALGLIIMALVLVACGGGDDPTPTAAPVAEPTEVMAEPTEEMMEATEEPMAEPTEEMMEEEPLHMVEKPAIESAVDLRVALTNLLGEHVSLASSATGAALDGRSESFEAAAASLDNNSIELAGLIGVVYGEDAQGAFLELWRTHIGFFVDYTVAAGAGDEAGMTEARENLDGYGNDFAAFLGSANPNIDPEAVKANLDEHIETLIAVIDAQAAGDFDAAYMNQRMAYHHMSMTGIALSSAISQQFPEAFPGEAVSPAADLRVGLNSLLAEHTYIASMATDAALGGRDGEFEAAAATLDENTVDLGAAIGSVYGEGAEEAFVALWREHIGFFVDYTTGAATDDQEMKDQAVEDLLGYRADFIAFLNGANENLTEDALTPVLTPHVGSLTTVIDAQADENWKRAYEGLRVAYAHMQIIADPLSGAIAAQFPEMFPDTSGAESTAPTSSTGAADLRIALNNLLGEHVLLASSATGAALDGRTDDFEAAAASLDENSVALSGAITSVYGEDAGAAFLELWRTHIGFFVDYTVAAGAGDEAGMAEARENLDGYGNDFAAFLGSANPNIDPEAVKGNLDEHIATLTSVIDAQAAGDYPMAYTNLRMAYHHMSMTALALSSAISQQFPDQFDGDAAAPAVELRVGLNSLLAEHTYIASMATDAALGGRDAEFEAAAAALDENTVDLGAAIGSVYGEGAEEAFVPLWREHIGFFVDYTLGVAGNDQAMIDQAMEDLLGYRADFIAFLNGANENLTEAVLTPILTPHVGTLTATIDAQGADDPVTAYESLREAYSHMQMIADPLAEAIVQQFPENFAG